MTEKQVLKKALPKKCLMSFEIRLESFDKTGGFTASLT